MFTGIIMLPRLCFNQHKDETLISNLITKATCSPSVCFICFTTYGAACARSHALHHPDNMISRMSPSVCSAIVVVLNWVYLLITIPLWSIFPQECLETTMQYVQPRPTTCINMSTCSIQDVNPSIWCQSSMLFMLSHPFQPPPFSFVQYINVTFCGGEKASQCNPGSILVVCSL